MHSTTCPPLAVPDGAIVLFSGLGPDAQKQLSVGVGTLAGSTIMLLTIPWSLCHFIGRVDIVRGADGGETYNYKGKPKLSPGNSIFSLAGLASSGVQVTKEIPTNAWIMLGTAAAYLIIWVPSLTYNDKSEAEQAKLEHPFAIAGLAITAVAFVAYSWYMVRSANAAEAYKERQAALIRQRFERDVSFNIYSFLTAAVGETSGAHAALLSGSPPPEVKERLAPVVRSLWSRADMNHDGRLDKDELRFLLCEAVKAKHMSEVPAAEVERLMAEFDVDRSSTLEFPEFEALFYKFVASHQEHKATGGEEGGPSSGASAPSLSLNPDASPDRAASFQKQASETAAAEDDEEEEDEEEDENAHLTPTQITLKAAALITVGVGVVTLFSDPMVDVLSEFGARIHVPPFYISFIVTPLVSNASELIASILFASKRTVSSMTMTFSALLGAATMNNTFVLAVFLGIMAGNNSLRWAFSAETLVILVVEIVMFAIALRTRFPTYWAWVVAALFPLSIVLVYVLENVAGLD